MHKNYILNFNSTKLNDNKCQKDLGGGEREIALSPQLGAFHIIMDFVIKFPPHAPSIHI